MTKLQAISLYEYATGESVEDWGSKERAVISSSVQDVRKSTSDAEAISAIGWLLAGDEDHVMRVVSRIKTEAEPHRFKNDQWKPVGAE